MPNVTREWLITYGGLEIASVASGTGVYTMDAAPPAWVKVDTYIHFIECTNSANDGTYKVTAVSGNDITTDNSSSVSEAGSPGEGGFPIGGSSEFLLQDKIDLRDDYDARSVTCQVIVHSDSSVEATSEREFVNRCASLEEAFRTPRQRLRVLHGSNVLFDLDPEAAAGKNTGFNQNPNATKADEFDSGRTRMYNVTIDCEVPADLTGQAGRRTSSIEISYEPNRVKTMTITGRYTALDANNARAQYTAAIAAYVTTVQTNIPATNVWEKQTETYNQVDDTDKNVDFTLVYKDIAYDQSLGGRDHASIIGHSLRIRRNRIAPGDFQNVPGGSTGSGGANQPNNLFGFGSSGSFIGGFGRAGAGGGNNVQRLVTLTVEYDAWIDSEETQDLRSLWTNTVRPWLVQNLKDTLEGGQVAITEETPDFDYADNRISCTMTLLGAKTSVVEFEVIWTQQDEFGWVMNPVWTGNPYSKFAYRGPAVRRWIEQQREVRIGKFNARDLGGQPTGTPSVKNWRLQTATPTAKPQTVGLKGNQFDLVEYNRRWMWEYFEPVPGLPAPGIPTGGQGGGQGGGSGTHQVPGQ